MSDKRTPAMQSTFAPARQQAHDLVDRLTLVQVSALISLFEPLAREAATLSRAPFCDELPIDAEEMTAHRAASAMKRPVARASAA
jgi:hypothetical protein